MNAKPNKNDNSDMQTTQMAGEFLTAGTLFKRGYQVAITLSNAKGVDLFAKNTKSGKSFSYVFVRLNSINEREEFYIIQGPDILDDINRFFGASYQDPLKISNRPGGYGPLEPYRDKWELFDH
jgi:hypothetical protein